MGLEEIKAENMTDEGEGVDAEIWLVSLNCCLARRNLIKSDFEEFILGFNLWESTYNGLKRKVVFPHTFSFE